MDHLGLPQGGMWECRFARHPAVLCAGDRRFSEADFARLPVRGQGGDGLEARRVVGVRRSPAVNPHLHQSARVGQALVHRGGLVLRQDLRPAVRRGPALGSSTARRGCEPTTRTSPSTTQPGGTSCVAASKRRHRQPDHDARQTFPRGSSTRRTPRPLAPWCERHQCCRDVIAAGVPPGPHEISDLVHVLDLPTCEVSVATRFRSSQPRCSRVGAVTTRRSANFRTSADGEI